LTTTGSTPADLLVATGLTKSYRSGPDVVHAVVGVDLTIRAGEFLAVTGRSGSGKTTLINCLSGLDDVDEGSVVIDGVDLATMSDAERTDQRARAMGFVFQSSNLLPVYTALENVALPTVLGGATRKAAHEDARAALERVGMGSRLGHYPDELSGGEQQRVAIARAFVKRPRIVWADEPTGNLDSKSAEQVLDLLNELHRDGATLILVTHDAALAERADRRIEFRDGSIVSEQIA
jgi:putative ABC transport system ATP-binding protein